MIHTRDRAQGIIVLSVLISSLWVGTEVLNLKPTEVAVWSITCGLLLSAVLHMVLFKMKLIMASSSDDSWPDADAKHDGGV